MNSWLQADLWVRVAKMKGFPKCIWAVYTVVEVEKNRADELDYAMEKM